MFYFFFYSNTAVIKKANLLYNYLYGSDLHYLVFCLLILLYMKCNLFSFSLPHTPVLLLFRRQNHSTLNCALVICIWFESTEPVEHHPLDAMFQRAEVSTFMRMQSITFEGSAGG